MDKIEIYNKKNFCHVYSRLNKKHYKMGHNEANILRRYKNNNLNNDDLKFIAFLERIGFFDKRKQTIQNIKIPIIKNFEVSENSAKRIINTTILLISILLIIVLITSNFNVRLSFNLTSNSYFDFLILIFSSICITFLHELFHAVSAKRYGVSVPEIGLNLKFLIPMGYADISGINYLKSKYKKINIILAGGIANLFVFSSLYVVNTFVNSELLTQIYSFSLLTIILNLFFYIKLDGYYFLEKIFEKEKLINYKKKDLSGEFKYVNLIIYFCFFMFFFNLAINVLRWLNVL